MPLKTALQQLDGWLREQGLLGQVRLLLYLPGSDHPTGLLAEEHISSIFCKILQRPSQHTGSLAHQTAGPCSPAVSSSLAVSRQCPHWPFSRPASSRLQLQCCPRPWQGAGPVIQPADLAGLGPQSDDGLRVQASEEGVWGGTRDGSPSVWKGGQRGFLERGGECEVPGKARRQPSRRCMRYQSIADPAGACMRARRWRNIEQPKYLRRWIDLSAVWFKHSNRRGNLRGSVEAAGLAWEGRPHSAIDDARNTARWVLPFYPRTSGSPWLGRARVGAWAGSAVHLHTHLRPPLCAHALLPLAALADAVT